MTQSGHSRSPIDSVSRRQFDGILIDSVGILLTECTTPHYIIPSNNISQTRRKTGTVLEKGTGMNFFICRTIVRRFTKGMALAVVTTLGILIGQQGAIASTFVVGGFDNSRGGILSFQTGVFFDDARASLSTNFPGASLNSFPTLTPAALAGVDVLILVSANGSQTTIVPLSAAEQSTLLAFVQGGGCAILLPDNSSIGDHGPANESLIDPFGLDIAGTGFNGLVIATVADPSASSITSGPFGVVSSFTQYFPGGLTNLGPFAISLGTNLLGTALAVIEKGAISPGSGRVVIYSDVGTFGDSDAGNVFAANELLFLNTIDFCLPEITVVDVDIDVKPGSFPNSINLGSGGATPVAILGSASLDVNDIDTGTLTLGTSGVKTVGKTDRTLCSVVDVSGDFNSGPGGAPDGFNDLVCHFVTMAIVPEAGDAQAKISGALNDTTPIEGTDSVNIVP